VVKLVRLNLGCGNDIRKGWENYDKHPVNQHVKHLDLGVLPLPFSDGYADEILLYGVYEHLWVNHFDFMKELSRILKKDGRLMIVVRGYKNIFDHERYLFNEKYFDTAVISYSLFKGIRTTYKRHSLKRIIGRIVSMFARLTVKEYVFELKK